MSDIEKCFIEKGKQSELWKTMYDRLVNCLPESKANLVKNSFQIEKQNIFDDQNNNDMLNHQIKKLNDDNLSLKMHLDNLKQHNQKELDRINEYKLENEKLKQELDRLFKESEVDVQSRNELNQQIERFKIKLRQEQDEKEEMRNRYEIELNAAKIRYENELEKQNKLMNIKYDALFNETSQLNSLVNSLQKEKSDLLGLIQREVALRKEINEHKEAINKRVVNNQNFACKRHSYSSGSNIQFIQSFSATDLQSCDISVNFVGSLTNESPDSSVSSSQTCDQIEKNSV